MRKLRPFLLLALVAPLLLAEVGGTNSISVTSVATTTTLSRTVATICISSDSASANELYARVFNSTETPAAATTSSPIVLTAGQSICLTHNTRTQPGTGWVGYSIVCDAGETATARTVTQ